MYGKEKEKRCCRVDYANCTFRPILRLRYHETSSMGRKRLRTKLDQFCFVVYTLSLIQLVSQTHTTGSFSAQIDTYTQKICWTSGLTPLTTYTILCSRSRSYLIGFTPIPGYHLQYIRGTCSYALSTADTGIIYFN